MSVHSQLTAHGLFSTSWSACAHHSSLLFIATYHKQSRVLCCCKGGKQLAAFVHNQLGPGSSLHAFFADSNHYNKGLAKS